MARTLQSDAHGARDVTGSRPRVAIIGGSIAGCAAAIAARRAGCATVVYERGSGRFADRGFGLTLAPGVYDELTGAGYLSPDAPALTMTRRLWMTRAGTSGDWRELWCQSVRMITCNWGLLWRSLRAEIADAAYRPGRYVRAVDRTADGRAVVRVAGPGGATSGDPYDLVVGADGHGSLVRARVAPGSTLVAAGYVLVRGVLRPDRLADDGPLTELLAGTGLTAMFDGGHAIVYLIPGDGGGPLVNWALYARPRRGVACDPRRPSFVPGAVRDDLVRWAREVAARCLPARVARIVDRTPAWATGVQPVFDVPARTLGRAPFALAGDAAAVARPHTGSGAVKALQDAMCLERMLRSGAPTGQVVAGYAAERTPAGNGLVGLGRRIGRDQVEATPDWSAMGPGEMSAYVAATWSGQHHYLHTEGLA